MENMLQKQLSCWIAFWISNVNNLFFRYLLFIWLLLYEGGALALFDRCSSCCCLYTTSSFGLQHMQQQQADSTYWTYKNNRPINNCAMNNSVTSDSFIHIIMHKKNKQGNSEYSHVPVLWGTDHHSVHLVPKSGTPLGGSPVFSHSAVIPALKERSNPRVRSIVGESFHNQK